MFQFPAFAFYPYVFRIKYLYIDHYKSEDVRTKFAAPRRLSQRITSFIACVCQGIHQMPLRHLIILIADIYPPFEKG